ALANLRKHGVSFNEACSSVFDDFAITKPDNRENYGEQRFYTLGMSTTGRLLQVVWTVRNSRYRLISAFIPEANQRKDYDKKRYR
ncbi:MAG: BrnT family toxin, partial [Neisseriaceae bacterium]|nr:BrnT family toxin [Neisseriaceae bacterium]